MKTCLSSLKLEKPRVFSVQIRDMIRDLILSGKFETGEKVPSVRSLAATWGTHASTVDVALVALEKEGLLIRHHGKGTFVQKRQNKLTCVGVYCGGNLKGALYARAVAEALKEDLCKIGVEMDLWMDTRPENQYGEPWKPLVKAAEQRRFQAFVAVETNLPLLEWQQKLPVPTAFLAYSVPTGVTDATEQFVELSLQELARQGCRSVGLIGPINSEIRNRNESRSKWLGMLDHFLAVAGDLNLQVKNSWMPRCPSVDPLGGRTRSQFGYEEFLKLWSQPEKPEGLVVFPADNVVTGTLMAIREKQVRVPEDLKLALAKNESIELFCPTPATFVVNSERATARALMEQIQRQFRGESCEPISLPYKIETHVNP